ncbi:MAG: hypothetical protein ACE366_04955 [Bradymonadia bacterium]
MRLRDIADRLENLIEGRAEPLFNDGVLHALVQEIRDVHMLYRPVLAAGRKSQSHAWLTFSFEPFIGLIEPFNIHPGRMWALVRMHRQSSGLPELAAAVVRDLPGTSEPVEPDIYVAFSQSPRVESVVKKMGRDPDTLHLYHRGGLPSKDQQSTLPRELCLPGFESALPAGDIEDNIPGLIEIEGSQQLFIGDLVFYNNFRTPDRNKVRNFVLNSTATAVVARYVREMVRKGLEEG